MNFIGYSINKNLMNKEEQKELKLKAIELLKKAKELSENINELIKTTEIKNIHKLKKRINAEVDFLDNVRKKKNS